MMSTRDAGQTRGSLRVGRVALLFVILFAVAVAIAAATGVLPVGFGGMPSLPAAPPVDLTHVGAWGRLAPRGDVRALAVPSLSDGSRIESLNVIEGQRIPAGFVVAVLDSHDRRVAAVTHAQTQLALAEARLDQVRHPAKPSEIDAQEALIAKLSFELIQAEADLKREETLAVKRLGVESMLEQARLKHKQASQNIRQAEAQLLSLKTPRTTDVTVAERQVDEARAALKQAEADLALTEIRSPCDATVLRIHARAGERVSEKGIVSIGDVDQMYAIAEIYEADLSRVTIGREARIRIPTLKIEVMGTVERIGFVVQRKDVFNIDPVADTDARVVEAWIKLSDKIPQTVRQLSNARVEVIIDVGPPIEGASSESKNAPTDSSRVESNHGT